MKVNKFLVFLYCLLILLVFATIEAGAVQLGNATTRFSFKDDGAFALLYLEHVPSGTYLQDATPGGEHLWRLKMRDSASTSYDVWPATNGVLVLDQNLPDEKTYTITWDDLSVNGETNVVDVVVTIRIPTDSALTYWDISVTNRSNTYGLWEVEFPRLMKLGPMGSPTDDVFISPMNYQEIDPYQNLVPRYAHYPGYASFQFCTLYDESSAGLYYASYDGDGYYKHFNYGRNDANSNVELYLSNYPENQGFVNRNYSLPYDIVIGTFVGDWWEPVKFYRQWALQQVWCSRGKMAWTADVPVWYKKMPVWEFTVKNWYVNMTAFASAIEHSYAGHWNYMWKHPGQGDAMFPDIFPPADGYAAFAATLAQAHAAGIKMIPYVLGSAMDQEAPQYVDWGAEPYVLRTESGALFKWNLDFTNHPDYGTWRLFPWICPYPSFWGDRLSDLCRQIMELGTDGIYFDVILNSYMCYSADHGHPVGGGRYYIEGNRNVLSKCRQEIRKVKPDAIMTIEGYTEAYIHLLDGMLDWVINPKYVPVFSAIYHDYITLHGHSINGGGMGIDYPVSLAMGIPLISGHKLGWTATPDTFREPEHASELAWYRKIIHYNEKCAHKFLGVGQMVEPPDLSGVVGTVSGDWGRGFTVRPSVLHSAWKADDDSLGVVLLNISETSQNISFDFNTANYGFDPGVETSVYLLGINSVKQLTRTRYGVFSNPTVSIEKTLAPLEVVTVEFVQTVPLFDANFEGTGPEGWVSDTDGNSTIDWEYADNGTGLVGSECLSFLPLSPTVPNYFSAEYQYDLTVAQQQAGLVAFGLMYDIKQITSGQQIYWDVIFEYTDGSSETFDSSNAHDPISGSVWTSEGPFMYTPVQANYKVVDNVKLKFWQTPVPNQNYWTRLDNVQLFGQSTITFGPETCQEVKDSGYTLSGDVNGDCHVDFKDFTAIAANWLKCNDPLDNTCD